MMSWVIEGLFRRESTCFLPLQLVVGKFYYIPSSNSQILKKVSRHKFGADIDDDEQWLSKIIFTFKLFNNNNIMIAFLLTSVVTIIWIQYC